jgi:hypothetical protein
MDLWELGRKRQIADEGAKRAQGALQGAGYYEILSWMGGAPRSGHPFSAVLASLLVDCLHLARSKNEPAQLSDLQEAVERAHATYEQELAVLYPPEA